MESARLLVHRMFQEVKIDPAWTFSDCSRSDTTKWSHGYHRYPAKFIPQLVEKLFDEHLSKSDCAHINDPFFGSGTTIVSAISRGFIASGTDINGVAYLITHTKSVPIEPDFLETKIRKFLIDIKPTSAKNFNIASSETTMNKNNLERINYWFTEENKLELNRILNIILEEPNLTIRRYLLTAFSHILKGCSIWLQRSTKPTRDKKKIPRDPYVSIRHHLGKMVHGNKAFYHQVPDHVRNNIDDYLKISLDDARNQQTEDSSVDLIVTSSPYVTSYEYADLHQLSTLWLDYTDDYRKYRKAFIGSGFRSFSKKELHSETAIDIVSKLGNQHVKTSQEVKEFFCDMEEVLQESYRILKPGGKCCYVIGNTTLKGVEIQNAEVFAETMIQNGLYIEQIIKRLIPTKILPQTRDRSSGRFTSSGGATSEAYPTEYILIGTKRT